MTFLIPLWLLALIPWSAIAAWAILNRGRRVFVPFVDLWRGPVAPTRPPRKPRSPPIVVIALLAAGLMSILGAAGPVLSPSLAGGGAAVIVDCGITMSAKGKSEARYREMIDLLRPRLDALLARDPSGVIVVPSEAGGGMSVDSARAKPPTAVDTTSALEREIRGALSTGKGPVIVLSDRLLPALNADPRVLWLRPSIRPSDVGITRFSASEFPRPQAMVRLLNQSESADVSLKVEGGAFSRERLIRLPPRGKSIDVFVDLPSTGDVLRASIDAHDDLTANNAAFLVRSNVPPRIEPRSSMPPELTRMIDVYARSRGAGGGGPEVGGNVIVVVDSLFRLPSDTRGVAMLGLAPDAPPVAQDASLAIEDHPLTRDIDWRAVATGARVSGPPGEGWLALVSSGDRVLLAVRTAPVRQAWVGMSSDTFPRTPDFVVLWTKIFDWLGGSGEGFDAREIGFADPSDFRNEGPSQEPPGRWPGVVANRAGRRIALNAPAVDIERDVATAPEIETLALATRVAPDPRRSLALRGGLLFASLILAAGVGWSRIVSNE